MLLNSIVGHLSTELEEKNLYSSIGSIIVLVSDSSDQTCLLLFLVFYLHGVFFAFWGQFCMIWFCTTPRMCPSQHSAQWSVWSHRGYYGFQPERRAPGWISLLSQNTQQAFLRDLLWKESSFFISALTTLQLSDPCRNTNCKFLTAGKHLKTLLLWGNWC